MTASQHRTIARINDALEAERQRASEASREVAQLDERSVLIAIEVKLAEGRIDDARALAQAWRASKGTK